MAVCARRPFRAGATTVLVRPRCEQTNSPHTRSQTDRTPRPPSTSRNQNNVFISGQGCSNSTKHDLAGGAWFVRPILTNPDSSNHKPNPGTSASSVTGKPGPPQLSGTGRHNPGRTRSGYTVSKTPIWDDRPARCGTPQSRMDQTCPGEARARGKLAREVVPIGVELHAPVDK